MHFASSAALQARSIFALLLRRIRSEYSGTRAGYAWALIEPIVWVFALKLTVQHGGSASAPPIGDSFEVFFAPGVTMARTWKQTVNQVCGILTRPPSSNLPSLYRLDQALANAILEMLTGLVAIVIMLSCFQLFGFNAIPSDPLICLIAYSVLLIYAISCGLFFALLETVMPALRHFRQIFLLILFITSGFAFVLDRMPVGVRYLISWNPNVHCIEWFREGFYRGYECRLLDLTYVFTIISIFMLFGLVAERSFRRKSREGALAQSGDEI